MQIIAFGLSFLFLLAWAGIKYTFVKELYQLFPFLNQFRWPGRALSVGGLFLILVSAYCLDFLFTSLDPQGSLSKMLQENFPRLPRLAVSSLLLLVLWFALRRVYQENGELIFLQRIKEPEVEASLDWLKELEEEQLTLRASIPVAQLAALGMYERGLRSPDIIDGWTPEASPLNIGVADAVSFQPKYWIDRAEDDVDHQALSFLRQFGDLRVWLNPDPFPYAFYVSNETLYSDDFEIEPKDVLRVLDVKREGFNRIQVELEPQSYCTLVVLESWFSGWRVFVDQQPVEIVTVSNYLAVPLSPGRHLVEFEYHSLAFTVGAWISGLSSLFIAGVLLRERRIRRAN